MRVLDNVLLATAVSLTVSPMYGQGNEIVVEKVQAQYIGFGLWWAQGSRKFVEGCAHLAMRLEVSILYGERGNRRGRPFCRSWELGPVESGLFRVSIARI